MILPGQTLAQAANLLERRGLRYEVTEYSSARPYPDATEQRVVRAVCGDDGVWRLVVCAFKTKIEHQVSQGESPWDAF